MASKKVGWFLPARVDPSIGDLPAADLQPLRDLGFSDLEILDITNGAAIFAWANRLLQTLGESQRAGAATS